MNAEYDITEEDLNAFSLYHHNHSPSVRRQYLRAWFVPACIWLFVCLVIWHFSNRQQGTPLSNFLALLPLFCGVPAYLLYFPWAYRRKLRKIVADMLREGKNRGALGRHQVAITPEGVTESGAFGQSSSTWQAVERVEKTEKYAFIYTSAVGGVIVPRRAFSNSADFDQFVQSARAYHAKATG